MRSNTASDRRRKDEDGNPWRTPILRCSAIKSRQVHGCAILADLEPLVRAEVILAFLFGPTSLFAEKVTDEVDALHLALAEVRGARDDILGLIDERSITKAQAQQKLTALNDRERSIRDHLGEVEASASASRLQDLRIGIWMGGHVEYGAAADVKRRLGERFDSLDVEARRALVSRLLKITVHRGRGADKYEIRHRVVTSLNGCEREVVA